MKLDKKVVLLETTSNVPFNSLQLTRACGRVSVPPLPKISIVMKSIRSSY